MEVEDRVSHLTKRLDELQLQLSSATMPPPPLTMGSLLRFESPLRKLRNMLLALLKEDTEDNQGVTRLVRRAAHSADRR